MKEEEIYAKRIINRLNDVELDSKIEKRLEKIRQLAIEKRKVNIEKEIVNDTIVIKNSLLNYENIIIVIMILVLSLFVLVRPSENLSFSSNFKNQYIEYKNNLKNDLNEHENWKNEMEDMIEN